jgi:hypothetical protein
MIRLFSVGFVLFAVALFAGLGLTGKEGKENAEEQEDLQDSSQAKNTASSNTGTNLPQPPADLASKCALTSLESPQGVAVCEEGCEISDCCEVPDGFALSCIADNEVVCAQYGRYCDILHNLPSAGFVPIVQEEPTPTADEPAAPAPAPAAPVSTDPPTIQSEIDQVCSAGDASSCESLCVSSFCCFNHYCVAPADINCLDYAGCFVLHSDPTTDCVNGNDNSNEPVYEEALADEIHEACVLGTGGDINQAAASTQCTTLCAPGACCFEATSECDEVNCAAYVECNILHPKFVSVTKPEVDTACSNHQEGSTTIPSLCEQVCSLRVMQCCFHENGAACDNALQHAGSAYCNTHQACGGTLGTAPDALRGSHKDELEAACTDANTRSQCIQLCVAATCCYATTIEAECANVDASITCSDYRACDVLYNS